jgi:serine/threonine protein kinase/WD40 repeat protein
MTAPKTEDYDLFDRLAEEFAQRYRQGERPALQEYIDRHPQLDEAIRELFPALVQMEQGEQARRDFAPSGALQLQQVGDYRILREVGRGGMGVVFEAEQQSLGRRVALKVLPPATSRDTRSLLRFRREARAAARLHHTNIVPVFEVGQAGDTCFYAMQFIPGQGLDVVIEELRNLRQHSPKPDTAAPTRGSAAAMAVSLVTGRFGQADDAGEVVATAANTSVVLLPGETQLAAVEQDRRHYFEAVARIGQQAALALAYAHARGVIHRDVKPSNLLLDSSGVVWITDFGLAKTEDDQLTATGEVVGTRRYMAPECFEGTADVRSDVYALGLTLYELLTLRPAFESGDRMKVLDDIQGREPPRPRSIDRTVPRDLETVVLKAMNKAPRQRYATAEELAEDLRRFLADEPVRARRASWAHHLVRWARRNPLAGSLTAAVLLLIVIVAIVVAIANLRLQARSEDVRRSLEDGQAKLWESYLQQARAIRSSHRPGQRFGALQAIRKALELPLPPGRSLDELRNEAVAALLLPDLEVAWEWEGLPSDQSQVAFDPAFERFAFSDKQGNVSVRRADTKEELYHLPGSSEVEPYFGLQFSPDGRFLAVVHRVGKQFRHRLWRLEGPQAELLLEQHFLGLAFSPDGRELVARFSDGSIRICDTLTTQERARFPCTMPKKEGVLRWSSCLSQVVVFGKRWRQRWQVLSLVDGKVLLEGFGEDIGECQWSPDGRVLAVADGSLRTISFWEVAAKRQLWPSIEGILNLGIVVAWDHLGDRVATNDWNGVLKLRDVSTGRELLSATANGTHVQFSRDDRLLAAATLGHRLQVFRFASGREWRALTPQPTRGPRSPLWIFSDPLAGHDLIAVSNPCLGMALVDVEEVRQVGFLPLPTTTPIGFVPDGTALLTHGDEGTLRWPLRAASEEGTLRCGPPQRLESFPQFDHKVGSSRDCDVLVFPELSEGSRLWRRGSPEVRRLGPQEDVRAAAVSPNGRWSATGSHHIWSVSGAKVWDSQTGKCIKELPVGSLCNVIWSPDGRWLLTSGGQEFRLWEAGTWREVKNFGSRPPVFDRGAFTEDGRLLVLPDHEGTIRLFCLPDGKEIGRFFTPESEGLTPELFTPDGSRLVARSASGVHLLVLDLRRIRSGLAELGLDWDAADWPPFSPEAPVQHIKEVQFDLGDLGNPPPANPPGK